MTDAKVFKHLQYVTDCCIEDPDSIYVSEFFLLLDEVFGNKDDYSMPVQAVAFSHIAGMLELERLRADNWSVGWLKAIAERDEVRSEFAALKEKHASFRESMAAIHNTIRGSGGHVSMSILLGASENAWRASAPVVKKAEGQHCGNEDVERELLQTPEGRQMLANAKRGNIEGEM